MSARILWVRNPFIRKPPRLLCVELTLKMDFTSKINLAWMDLHSDHLQSPVTLGLAGFVATLISFLAYLSYTPRVDKRSPAFTSDTVPFVGSWGFFTRKQ